MNKNILYYCEVGSNELKPLPRLTEIPKFCVENGHQYDEVVRTINSTKNDFEIFVNEYEYFKNFKNAKKFKSSKAKKIIKRSMKK